VHIDHYQAKIEEYSNQVMQGSSLAIKDGVKTQE